MPLPFPHGDASGQIAHMASYSTSDTPTSTGGRFIGFGEPGTSEVGNRAHWALSANIDYVHTKITQEIAIPKGYDRTSPGGGESAFQFPAGEEIWVGDTTYPGSAGSSDLEGMHMLFDVLDSNYNELTDGADNEIRVKLVRESTNTTDVYKGGNPFLDSFQDQPIIHFIAVDPATGAIVTDPYTIPAATNYKVQCGVKSTIAELPADALVRYKVQGASELEAGMLLQDGTRPMTGDLDLDSNDILNPGSLNSLVTSSLSATLNAAVDAQEMITGNRSVDNTGSFTLVNERVTYPELKVMLQGQIVTIPTGYLDADPDDSADTHYLYVTPGGTVTLVNDGSWGDAVADPAAGSVLIWKGDYDGVSAWSNTVDLRWPNTSLGNHVSVYVGSGVGADFTSLNDAVTWANEIGLGVKKSNISYEFVVVGTAQVTETVILPAGWTLRGLSSIGYVGDGSQSVIEVLDGFTITSHVITAGVYCTIKDLKIYWNSSADQDAAYAGLNVSLGCTVERVLFTNDFGGADKRFGININVAGSADNIGSTIRDCYLAKFKASGVASIGEARVRVEDSEFISHSVSPYYHIDFSPDDTSGDATGPGHVISGCYFKGKGSTANIRVGGPNVLIDSCQAELSGGASSSPFIYIDAVSLQVAAGVTVRNCLLSGGKNFIRCDDAQLGATTKLSVYVSDCVLDTFETTIFNFNCGSALHAESIVSIQGCNIQDQAAGYIGYFTNVQNVHFSHNNAIGGATTGLVFGGECKATIDSNTINSSASGTIITLSSDYCKVLNNIIEYAGAGADAIGIEMLSSYNHVADNFIAGDTGLTAGKAATAIKVTKSNNKIIGNYIKDWTTYCIRIDGLAASITDIQVSSNVFDTCCFHEVNYGAVTDVQAAVIYRAGSYSVTGLIVDHNIFRNIGGSALFVSSCYGLRIDSNVFYEVNGRYLESGPIRLDYFALYLSVCKRVSISNNVFTDCGYEYTGTGTINAGIIKAMNFAGSADVLLISNNEFGSSIASNDSGVSDSWFDIYIGTKCAALCNNNTFYRSLTSNRPTDAFNQIYMHGVGDLIVTGCLFYLYGTTGVAYPTLVNCVRADSGLVLASGCLTEGTWTTTAASQEEIPMWDLDSEGGSVIGCIFRGNHDVDLYQGAKGFCLGNHHYDQTSRILAIGALPNDTGTLINDANPQSS
jgi:hypothetical protein